MYEVNSLGILAANILLKNQKFRKKYLIDVKKGKNFLLSFFKSKKIKFLDTAGNFILFKLDKKKFSYFKKMKLKKINIVENIKYKNLKDYSRITLAPKKEMYKFIKILKNY